MSLLKRTFTSLYNRIDLMVGDIENHDALIQAAIKEQKNKIAGARVQLRKVESSEKRIAEQLGQLSINAKLWTQRASNEAKDSEQQALLCLQRRQKVQHQMAKLQPMKDEYHQSTVRMKQDIQQCEDDLAAMMQKHQMMRARQSTAEAMQIVDRGNSTGLEVIESSFDRWEVKISQGEFSVDRFEDSVDDLEQEYLREESEDQLRYELAELLKDNALNGANTPDADTQGGES